MRAIIDNFFSIYFWKIVFLFFSAVVVWLAIYNTDFWKIVLPFIGAVIAWLANEWQKRIAEQYQRKEANYKELMRSLRGFYIGASNADELKCEFSGSIKYCVALLSR